MRLTICCALFEIGCTASAHSSPVQLKHIAIVTARAKLYYIQPSSLPSLLRYVHKIHWRSPLLDTSDPVYPVPVYFLECTGVTNGGKKRVQCVWGLDRNFKPFNYSEDSSQEFKDMAVEVQHVTKLRMKREK